MEPNSASRVPAGVRSTALGHAVDTVTAEGSRRCAMQACDRCERRAAPVTVLGSLARPAAVKRLRAVAVRLLEERYLGVHTGVQIRPQELGYRQGLYLASSWLVLRELFRNMEVAEDDVFVDIGSGMGRVVFMAARRPFKRVIGVERSLWLNEVARGIVDRRRRLLACQDVALLTVDALEWDVPDGCHSRLPVSARFRTLSSSGSSTG